MAKKMRKLHPNVSMITEAQVLECWNKRAKRKSFKEIAAHMPFSEHIVARIVRGELMSHVVIPPMIRELAEARNKSHFRAKRVVRRTVAQIQADAPHDTITDMSTVLAAYVTGLKQISTLRENCIRMGWSEEVLATVSQQFPTP